jgi:DNA polymerase-1
MTEERLDSAGVLNKFGVPPERIVDYLSIMGDSVDNVPGVPKAGPKTAVKWLNEFGTLDELMKRSSEVKGVVGENLRASLDWLPKARELVTVKIDCDLNEHLIGLHELHAKSEDKETLRELFIQFGFKSLLRDLDRGSLNPGSSDQTPAQSGSGEGVARTAEVAKTADAKEFSGGDLFGFVAELPTEKIERHYSCVTTEAELDVWLEKINSATLTCVDTETTGLDALRVDLVGISLAVSPGEACYIPLAHSTNEDQLDKKSVLEKLRPWLESDEHAKLGQNLKYDIHIFDGCGIKLRGVQHDTLLQSYVLESHRSHDMDSLAMRHLGERTIAYEEVCGKGVHQITFDQVNLETATQYAAEDADITLRLHHAMYPAIEADEKLLHIYRKIEIPAMLALAVMERNGILIDSVKLAAQGQIVGQRLLELEKQIHELAGQPFNIQSPKQIAEILFGKLELPVVKKTPSGAPSTDEEVLQKLAENYPLPARILDYRSLAKLQSTYIEKLPRMVNPKTGRVHTNYSQAVAVTGRLASSEPNLQNIPVRTEEGRKIREAFIPKPGSVMVSAD